MYLVIDEEGKIRKFKNQKRMENFIRKQNGICFVIIPLYESLLLDVVKSENGNMKILKSMNIDGYT